MNMIGNLLGGMISDEQKENAIREVIQDALEDVSEELGCNHKDLFFMIQPYNDQFDFRIYIYKIVDRNPKMIREIPLAEILG